jgi:hypothetical protein
MFALRAEGDDGLPVVVNGGRRRRLVVVNGARPSATTIEAQSIFGNTVSIVAASVAGDEDGYIVEEETGMADLAAALGGWWGSSERGPCFWCASPCSPMDCPR